MFIVVWLETSSGPDRWMAFDNESDAKEKFFDCVLQGFYTVSMCNTILSTDYSPIERKPLDWVKKLGQWHLADQGESVTRCGRPMLGNNYRQVIAASKRTKCSDCWG